MSTLTHFAQGLLMGGSDAIPGVSGGTMALIVGIYRRLIDSISSFVSLAVATVRFDAEERRRHFREVEWRLVLPLAAGILVAFAAAMVVIPVLLERYPEQMRGLFFGLVAASVAIPWLRIRTPKAGHAALVIAFAVAAYVLVGLPQQSAEAPSLVRVFFSASVAICAMILPGVSGAYLLHAFGVYEVSLEHFKNVFERVLGATGVREATLSHAASGDLLYAAAFVGGAVFGLGAFSKVLDWFLEHYHDATMAALTGLMAGALRALWPWQTETRELLSPGDPLWSPVALCAVGFVFIVVITWIGSERLDEDPGEPNPARRDEEKADAKERRGQQRQQREEPAPR
jgi:putative membrane protein